MQKKGKIFFTVDFEDWFHIPYLKKYNFNNEQFESYADKILDFMKYLAERNILATVFVVADFANDNSEIIKTIANMGHEIACHGYSHTSINQMTNEQFVAETKEAKQILEKIIGDKIYGYRAAFFSMTEKKLELLKQLGFKYDSSHVQAKFNEYYNVMRLHDFKSIDNLVYKKDDFFEFTIPVLKMGKLKINIAGGGYFRLYPYAVFKFFLKRYLKKNRNYIFYVHPVEIHGSPFNGLRYLNLKDKIRFQIGRKNNLKKIQKMLGIFQDYEFIRMKDYLVKEVPNESKEE